LNLCPLCHPAGEVLLWSDLRCRVISAGDPRYPGFCRVVWGAHVREMTELGEQDQTHLMRVTFAVESTLRALLQPAKINLASFGNVVPHLHWHVIPRFDDDAHFPDAIWANPTRPGVHHPVDLDRLRAALEATINSGAVAQVPRP
jgi:diadenosine tetraphosphate (Ap4A) HIT family hydrolase